MGGCNIQQRDGLKWIGFQDFAEIAHNLRDVLAGRPGTLLTYYVQGRLWQSPLAPQQLLRELSLRPKQVVWTTCCSRPHPSLLTCMHQLFPGAVFAGTRAGVTGHRCKSNSITY